MLEKIAEQRVGIVLNCADNDKIRCFHSREYRISDLRLESGSGETSVM